MVVVYGIKNCDTVKNACRWLKNHSTEYSFHDFREQGLSHSKIKSWLKKAELETLLNRRSTT
jgi:arsenate reductase-like glutaredoxin family protein